MRKKLKKRFAICFPSGTVLFWTDNEATASNRKSFGWKVYETN